MSCFKTPKILRNTITQQIKKWMALFSTELSNARDEIFENMIRIDGLKQ